jgi:uncharacterized RDD family membrane protein YckC
MSRPWVIVLVLVLGAGWCGCLHADEPDTPLIAAGDRTHVWYVAQRKGGTYALFHHDTSRQPPSTTNLIELTSRPIAMAAWDARLWLIFDGGCTEDICRYKVCTTRLRSDPEFNQDQLSPAGRLDVEPTLQQRNPLAGCVATADGPVVLFMPAPSAGREIRDEHSGELRSGRPDPPALRQLRKGEWQSLPVPDALVAGRRAALLPPGPDGRSFRMLIADDQQPPRVQQFVFQADEVAWSDGQPLDLNLRDVQVVLRVAFMPTVVLGPPDAETGMLELAYVRTDGVLPIGTFRNPQHAWGITGQDDGARLVGQRSNNTFWISRIDALSGTVDSEQTLGPPRLPLSGFFHRVMLLLAMVGSVVIVFTMRPGSREIPPLPDGVQPMALGARSLALLIDLLPSGLVAMLLFSANPADLLVLPIAAMDFNDSFPFLVMAGITLLHQGVSESIWSTTLGKFLFGGRILLLDDSPRIWRVVLIRTVIKSMTYLIPPIVLLMITNHNLQGIGDILSRSVVVSKRPDPSSEE